MMVFLINERRTIIRLIICENVYFVVDDVYATSVQRLALKRKRREY